MSAAGWRCMGCAHPIDELLVLPCTHRFCTKCMTQWLESDCMRFVVNNKQVRQNNCHTITKHTKSLHLLSHLTTFFNLAFWCKNLGYISLTRCSRHSDSQDRMNFQSMHVYQHRIMYLSLLFISSLLVGFAGLFGPSQQREGCWLTIAVGP